MSWGGFSPKDYEGRIHMQVISKRSFPRRKLVRKWGNRGD